MSQKTRVTMLSWTANPMETVYAEWIQSRTQDPVPYPADTAFNAGYDYELKKKVLEIFEKVVAMKMPLGETVSFTFLLEHCPIALREQLVRHRIGHKFGEKIGADIIPDLAGTSSFWSQTTRIINMGKFADDGEYLTPIWLEEHPEANVEAPGYTEDMKHYYETCMLSMQEMYKNLVEGGMPLEDARNVLPVAMQHRLTWTTNLSALMNVLSRRGCWLAQLGMWEPVIMGIVEELATKIHPTFRRLIDPPCIGQDGEFNTCAFKQENDEIVQKGEYPPCTLWIHNDSRAAALVSDMAEVDDRDGSRAIEEALVNNVRMPRFRKMQEKYTKLWGRDPRTGERKQLV